MASSTVLVPVSFCFVLFFLAMMDNLECGYITDTLFLGPFCALERTVTMASR
jgi:hypothetical protein